MQVGIQGLGRLPEGCSCSESLWSRRNLHQDSHLQRRSQQMSGLWLTFQSLQGHSTRTHGGLVHPLASAQVAGEYPSLFPSNTLVYSQKSTQLHQCETGHSEGGNLHFSTCKLLHKDSPSGNETHNFLAALIINVLS